jgi:hypothetical protein
LSKCTLTTVVFPDHATHSGDCCIASCFHANFSEYFGGILQRIRPRLNTATIRAVLRATFGQDQIPFRCLCFYLVHTNWSLLPHVLRPCDCGCDSWWWPKLATINWWFWIRFVRCTESFELSTEQGYFGHMIRRLEIRLNVYAEPGYACWTHWVNQERNMRRRTSPLM